jgi:hypothetical protein
VETTYEKYLKLFANLGPELAKEAACLAIGALVPGPLVVADLVIAEPAPSKDYWTWLNQRL